MDFVLDLSRSPSENDVIWVIVDRLTKSAQSLPIRKDAHRGKHAKLYE